MINKKQLFGLLFGFALISLNFGIPKIVQKKMVKEVSKTFEVADFSTKPLEVDASLNSMLPTKITTDNFYQVFDGTNLLGYAFVDKAPSKTAQFDYLVIFDTELKVIHSKVLVYREEYGGEIGSKRWLQQFMGMTGDDRVSHETNIDGIAGATISVRSMTNSMDKLLQTIGILQVNKVL